MAGAMRSVLSDMFREAIVEGHIVKNPVEATRIPEIKVARERLQLETYNATRTAAEHLPVWFSLAMDLALVTGQRREDIVNMKFSDVFDNRLYVTQIKTGMKIAIPLSLTLEAPGLRLGTVIDRCRLVSRTDFMISAGIRKNSPTGNIHPDGLTKTFVKQEKPPALTSAIIHRHFTRSEVWPGGCTKTSTARCSPKTPGPHISEHHETLSRLA